MAATTQPMSPSTPRLSEVARHLVYPAGIVSTGWTRINRRLSDMAIQYDSWQSGAVQLILGRDEFGRYVATIGGVTMSIPRQVGKTFTIGSLLVAMALEYPGLRVVWTSHHGRTTTNTFRAMQGMVKRKRIAPFVESVRIANGEQEIKFTNNSIIMFGAREHGFGVGIDAIDVLVCDEAQRLSSRALADMMPTTNQAQHQHGALVFFIGTPPRPDNQGDEFAARRAKAIAGEMKNGIYIELSADQDADLDDPEQWAKANASYPHRTPHESMLRLRENLTNDDDWRREAMGIWDEHTLNAVIPIAFWETLEADGPTDGVAPTAIAVDASHDGIPVVAACWRIEDQSHVELLGAGEVTDEALADWIANKVVARKIPVTIDGASPAARLIPLLESRRVKVTTGSSMAMSKACGGLYAAVVDGLVTWGGTNGYYIGRALAGAKKRKIGDAGGWGWDRRSLENNISPLVAVTLAHYGASNAKKRTGSGRTPTDGRKGTSL